MWNGGDTDFYRIEVAKDPHCPVCGQEANVGVSSRGIKQVLYGKKPIFGVLRKATYCMAITTEYSF